MRTRWRTAAGTWVRERTEWEHQQTRARVPIADRDGATCGVCGRFINVADLDAVGRCVSCRQPTHAAEKVVDCMAELEAHLHAYRRIMAELTHAARLLRKWRDREDILAQPRTCVRKRA